MSASDDPLLVRLLAAEIDENHPSVRKRMSEDPTFREEVESLRAVERSLGFLADEDREAVQQAVRETGDEDRAIARRALRAASSGPTEDRSGPPRNWTRWALAATVVLTTGLATWYALRSPGSEPGSTGPVDHGQRLGSGEFHPKGAVESYLPFRVQRELAAGEKLEFRVWDGDGAADDAPLFESGAIGVNEWTPPVPTGFTWPARLRWEAVVVHEWTGNRESMGVVEAWRER